MKAGPFEEFYIATIIREVLKGLDYLHCEKKLHRDIKGRLELFCAWQVDKGVIISFKYFVWQKNLVIYRWCKLNSLASQPVGNADNHKEVLAKTCWELFTSKINVLVIIMLIFVQEPVTNISREGSVLPCRRVHYLDFSLKQSFVDIFKLWMHEVKWIVYSNSWGLIY